MPLFSKKDHGELILILDVQSSVVRGSLVRISHVAPPHIFYTYSANIPYQKGTDSAYLIQATLKAVMETVQAVLRDLHIRRAEKDGVAIPRTISGVHYALSSPWIVSQAKVLSMSFDKDTRITRSFILGLIDDERKKLVPSPSEPLSVIEEKIFDVRLNGYSVAAWEGKETRELSVSFTISIAGARMVDEFVEAALPVVRPSRVSFHSSLLLQHIGVSLIFPDRENYTLLNIHGELSDLAVIRHKACVFFGSYPSGVRTLIRDLAAAVGGDEQSADSLLTLYTGGHLDSGHGRATVEAVDHLAEAWVADIKALLAESNLPVPPPIEIVLSAWAHDDFYIKILHSAFPKIRVDLLSIDDILTQVSFEAKAERRRLTGLYAAALRHML